MLPTGRRSSTRRPGGGRAACLAAALVALGAGWTAGSPASALDFFTLWRQPEIPLQLKDGAWIDVRSQVMAGGREESTITRVVCLSAPADAPAGSWVLEILPLHEARDGRMSPVPGEGARLVVAGSILERQGLLLDAVLEARQWRNGVSSALSKDELREDPLVSASLQSDFQAELVERQESTTRVIGGRQFLCDQLVMSAQDTQAVDLPAGRMVQVTSREITAAVNRDLPLLGLAYASERIRSESTLDPPSSRLKPPPPRVRVEVMELIAFGADGAPTLGGRR